MFLSRGAKEKPALICSPLSQVPAEVRLQVYISLAQTFRRLRASLHEVLAKQYSLTNTILRPESLNKTNYPLTVIFHLIMPRTRALRWLLYVYGGVLTCLARPFTLNTGSGSW